MKAFLILLASAAFAAAQSNGPQNPPPVPAQPSEPYPSSIQLRVTSPAGRVIVGRPLSGALIEAVRSPKPMQLINPFAPRVYGDGWRNVSIDPITGRAQGIKLISISF